MFFIWKHIRVAENGRRLMRVASSRKAVPETVRRTVVSTELNARDVFWRVSGTRLVRHDRIRPRLPALPFEFHADRVADRAVKYHVRVYVRCPRALNVGAADGFFFLFKFFSRNSLGKNRRRTASIRRTRFNTSAGLCNGFDANGRLRFFLSRFRARS